MPNGAVKFYWESKGEKYRFSREKKYLIYFRGCYCPPHKGHFNTIADFKDTPNTKFIIHQGGSETRHGFPMS